MRCYLLHGLKKISVCFKIRIFKRPSCPRNNDKVASRSFNRFDRSAFERQTDFSCRCVFIAFFLLSTARCSSRVDSILIPTSDWLNLTFINIDILPQSFLPRALVPSALSLWLFTSLSLSFSLSSTSSSYSQSFYGIHLLFSRVIHRRISSCSI